MTLAYETAPNSVYSISSVKLFDSVNIVHMVCFITTRICIYDRIRFLHLLPNKVFVYLSVNGALSSVFVSKCL